MKTSSNHNGFTIIELIMVVCMIALVMAFAGPSLDGYTREIRTKAVAREIYTNLQLARLTAIKENKSVDVTFTLTSGAASMSVQYSGGGYVRAPVKFPVNFYERTPDITLASNLTTAPFPAKVTYKPMGTVDGIAQIITVIHNNPQIVTQYNYDITINASGGLKLAKK